MRKTEPDRATALVTLDEQRDAIEAVAKIDDLDTLRNRLFEHWTSVGYHLAMTVAVIRRMEELGYRFTEEEENRVPLLQLLRLVASGQILLNLLIRYFTTHARLFAIARWLPVHDQERIAENDPMKLMLEGGDHRMLKPSAMNPLELEQMFDRREAKIRNEGEQLAWLRERKGRELVAAGTEATEEPVKFIGNGVIIVLGDKRLELSLRRLEAIVAQLKTQKRERGKPHH